MEHQHRRARDKGTHGIELIARRGLWRGLEAVEFATLEWVHWYNHRRLLGPIGYIPPAQKEADCFRQPLEPAIAA